MSEERKLYLLLQRAVEIRNGADQAHPLSANVLYTGDRETLKRYASELEAEATDLEQRAEALPRQLPPPPSHLKTYQVLT